MHTSKWPEWSAELAADPLVTLIVQINGKVRDRITVPAGTGEQELRALALASEGAKRYTEGKQVVKVIVAEGKLVNIVVR